MKQKKRKKRKSGARGVLVIVLVLIAGIGTGLALMLSGVLNGLFAPKAELPAAYTVEGNATVLRLAAAPASYGEEALRGYYAEALDYAAATGFDTLLFEAKTGLAATWRDKIFPAAPAVAGQDTLFTKLDPLAILLQEAEGRGVQVWLEIDPYATGGYTGEEKGQAAKYIAKNGLAATGEGGYTGLVLQSLAALPQTHPVAGLVLAGVDGDATLPTALKAAWQAEGLATGLILSLPAGAGGDEIRAGQESYDAVLLPLAADGSPSTALAPLSGGSYYLQPSGEGSALLLFTAMTGDGFSGALLAAWPDEAATAAEITLLKASYQTVDAVLPTGYTLPQSLRVTNPENGASVAHSQDAYYVVGTSNPAEPLLLNGEEVLQTETGLFGQLVPLAYGSNTFTFTQGGDSASVTITRQSPPSGSGGGGAAPEYTTTDANGMVVEVSSVFAHSLTDWTNGGSTDEVFFAGAQVLIDKIVRRDGTPVAYRMANGQYLLPGVLNTSPTYNGSDLGSISAQSVEGGEYINFSGTATPAAYVAYDSAANAITLTMYNTSVTVPEGFSSEYVKAASVSTAADGATLLRLECAPIWGYQLEYTGSGIRFFIKRVPTLHTDGSLPLTGVTFLLDPGHGGTDVGAYAGIVGKHLEGEDFGPYEKDLCLSVAQATAYRLQQLGATVVFTREDDSYSESPQRLELLREVKPDFFISFHRNSLEPNRDLDGIGGTEVYYFHIYDVANSKLLAENLTNSITNHTGRNNRGAKWSYYNVTLASVCPAVLAEYGFISSPTEYEGMLSAEDIYLEAEATVEALLATLQGETIEYNG